MARQNDEFSMAWSSLVGDGQEVGWQTISVTPAGPLELRAGRRAPENAEAMLVGFPSVRMASAEKLPEGQGFTLERVSPNDSDVLWLALTRKTAGNSELFMDMICNVAGALDQAAEGAAGAQHMLQIFVGRVGAWQEFMRRGSQTLGAEAEIGLLGELATLLEVIEAGVASGPAIEGWLGPLDGIQDFELGTGALEVKSTLSLVGFPAHIGSLEQLDDAIRQPLFVVGKRFRQVDSGLSLSDFVASVRAAIPSDSGAESFFEDRLIAAGYFDSHAGRYSRRFVANGTLVVEVGESFPRLTIGGVPSGLVKAAYDIDLEKASGHRVDLVVALEKMGAV